MEQAVREIVEVVQALAEVGVRLAQHAGAVVGLHPLDRGFRSEAREHRLAHAPQPALVVGEHPEGFQHLPVLAVMGDVAALDQLVDGGPDLADGLVEALHLRVHVLGDEVLHHTRGSWSTTWPRPTPSASDTPRCAAPASGRRGARRSGRLQFARRSSRPPRTGVAGSASDFTPRCRPAGSGFAPRHPTCCQPAAAEPPKSRDRLFPGLGLVGEGRVRLRVREREGLAVWHEGRPAPRRSSSWCGERPRG
jgi:hypothetical protein